MLNERRRLVLKALIEEYIDSGEPVGSRHLVEHRGISCSSATVRNELAALEESGHVYQPHVSSGRIPTDAGYREFVDGLLQDGPSGPDVNAEQVRLRYRELSSEVDDLMKQTSFVLSHLTHYVAVVLAPTISLARIRRIDLVSLAPRHALVVLITATGQVVNRHVDLAEETQPEQLAEVERALNASLDGRRAAEVRSVRQALDPVTHADGALAVALEEIAECLEEADRDRLYHVGVPELLALPEFADSSRLRPLLGLLEDGLAMLDTLSDVMSSGGMTVRIGSENTRSELGEMSLVVSNYATAEADGLVGVIGPTRMDYPRTISTVRGVADGLSDTLG
ncbi:MAG: heat-inducible transcriptional repressor HrcA [Coriobacteriia bacterium]|nr:heat-inducible transcriptional repressor HrcA [Coriobacteriia bacterium]